MSYYINTSTGPMTNDLGDVKFFNSHSDCRHFAINYCDLSDRMLEIINFTKLEDD